MRVYSVCRQPNYGHTPMVECTGTMCQEWYHLQCVNALRKALNSMEVPTVLQFVHAGLKTLLSLRYISL